MEEVFILFHHRFSRFRLLQLGQLFTVFLCHGFVPCRKELSVADFESIANLVHRIPYGNQTVEAEGYWRTCCFHFVMITWRVVLCG